MKCKIWWLKCKYDMTEMQIWLKCKYDWNANMFKIVNMIEM
jgi:hypothetical protein